MRRKGILFVLSLMVSVLLFAFASCDNESDDVIRGKISDVLLTVNDTDYDFYENVSFVDENGRRMEFTCNDSVVEFGKAGKYTLIYQVGVMQYERLVYIYGAPTISVSNAAVEYQDAIVKDFSAYVKARDTFGKEVPVSLNGDLQYDSNGAVVTGNQEFSFSATDLYGNQATVSVTLNVLSSKDTFSIGAVSIDYARPYYTLEIGNRKVVSVYCDGERLDETFYVSNNGMLMFTPEFATKFGQVTGKDVYVNFNTCTAKMSLSITDNQPTAYKVDGSVHGKNFHLLDEITLPRLEKTNASMQNAAFKYYVEYEGLKTLTPQPTLVPTAGGDYTFIAEIYRNGELADTVSQTFAVSHYSANLIGVTAYVALGKTYDYSLQTDLIDLDVDYTVTDNDGILNVVGNTFTVKKEGTASVAVNINDGEIVKTIEFTAIDFYNGVGETRDVAKTLSFWSAESSVSVTYENAVNDLRTSALQYSFNALKSTGDVALDGNLIDVAKDLGYKYITFTAFLDNSEASLDVFAQKDDEEERVYSVNNGGRWQYNVVALSEIADGSNLVFVGNGADVYLAKVEFIGADISAYAATYLAESATAGKSEDLVMEGTWGKIVQTVCNTNNSNAYTDTGMDKVSAGDNGDYFTFTRSGYVSTYGRVENCLYISSEWIMAAKKLGYSVIGVWMGKYEGYSMLKRSADGTLSTFKNNGAEWHAGVSSGWGFISLDLTDFEVGDTVVISLSGESACVAGITFRTMDYAVPNLKAN